MVVSVEMVRVGLNYPYNGTCANVYAHVVVVRVHVWRTLCSVCATGARVAHPFPICRVLEVSPPAVTLLFQLVVALDW